jgi:lipoate-protein ligase A
MRYDSALLRGVERGIQPPILRIFRFKNATVSFGRLQKLRDIAPLVTPGWDVVQRPTGGGIVFHKNDLCLSLCWPRGHAPLPARAQDQYRWIHSVIMEALGSGLRMAACGDAAPPSEPFATRTCFQNPVGYDLLDHQKKIVGGALQCTRRAILYQGSLQRMLSASEEEDLLTAFQTQLHAGS